MKAPAMGHHIFLFICFLLINLLNSYKSITHPKRTPLQGAQWELSGEDEPRVRFWGSSVDIHLNWTDVLTFSDGDTYSWRKVCAL